MRFYKVSDEGVTDNKPMYFCTRADAQQGVKDHYGSGLYGAVFVDLVEIKTDQRTVSEILSGWGHSEVKLQSWAITARGGLKEIKES